MKTPGGDRSGLMDRLPTCEEIDSAAHTAAAVTVAMELDDRLKVTGENDDPVKTAPAVGELNIDLLGHVSNRNMVTLVSVGTMLTTQEAAEVLNVSRPRLTKLLKEGKVKFEKVSKHRSVPLASLRDYREQKAKRQEQAMQDLTRLDQDFHRG